jgi:hypothetical protein
MRKIPASLVVAGQEREARLHPDDPAIHPKSIGFEQ